MDRRLMFGLAMVLLAVGTGCPHDWMPDGTNDRAARKDVREQLRGEPCTDVERQRCKQNEPTCRRQCR